MSATLDYARGYREALDKAAAELEQTARELEAAQVVKIPKSGTIEILNAVKACAQHLKKMRRP